MQDRSIRNFLLVYAAVMAPALLAVSYMDRFTLHMAANANHSPLLDHVFSLVTHLADSWVPLIVALLFLIKDHRSFLMVGLSAGLSALAVQLIKFGVDQPRPSMCLGLMPGLPMVDGVELLRQHSFPSGHSAAAFSTCFAIAVVVARPVPAFLLALLACGIGLSRIYLSQHFTHDVVAGATIGTFTAVVIHRWLFTSSFAERPWLDRTLFSGRKG